MRFECQVEERKVDIISFLHLGTVFLKPRIFNKHAAGYLQWSSFDAFRELD